MPSDRDSRGQIRRPTDEMLADYATGAATPGVALLIAAHLTHRPESRAAIAAYESVAGALLAEEAPATLSASALERAMAEIDDGAARTADPGAVPHAEDAGPLPRPVAEAVGIPFAQIPWRTRLPGVAEFELAGFDGERVSLLRARPGAGIPQHTHRGRELTLVLAGELQDGATVYRAGDLAINDEDDDHKPTIVGSEVCYCLVVMDGRLHFTGTFGRALNLLAE